MEAQAFATEWIAAWNALDVGRVLRMYTDDFEMSSPHIVTIANEPSGTLRGKPAVRAYWVRALELYPGLHFTLDTIYQGVDSVVLAYTNQNGGRCGEVLLFNAEGKIYKSAANHAV